MSKYSCIFLIILGSLSTVTRAQTNEWQESLHSPWVGQVSTTVYDIHFKDNGPFGYGWIYGNWLDLDSNLRLASYRKGGKWNSIPVYSRGPSLSYVTDIIQYGDTLYLCGQFSNLMFEADTSKKIPNTSLLKIFEDSIWTYSYYFTSPHAMTSSGDTLMVWADSYMRDSIIIPEHLMTTDGGQTWQYPYSKTPPGSDLGYNYRFEINDGKIYAIQSAGPDSVKGVVVWDGVNWEVLGDGIYGTYSRPSNFIFNKDVLYMSGHYSTTEDPRNPGNFITRWTGSHWEEFGGGIDGLVLNEGLFILDSILFCHSRSNSYGDANIQYIAGWNGIQWCGTPITYSPSNKFGPTRAGVINDTLYSFCANLPLYADGKAMSMLNYFDGDYFKGPSSICSTVGLGIDEESAKPRVALFPNPATNEINITWDGETPQKIRIYDSSGRKVLDQKYSEIINIRGLKAGQYVLEIVTGSGLARSLLIIQNNSSSD